MHFHKEVIFELILKEYIIASLLGKNIFVTFSNMFSFYLYRKKT